MVDTEFLMDRAQREISAALKSSDRRVRDAHLDMADAYLSRLHEARVEARRAEFRLVDCGPEPRGSSDGPAVDSFSRR